MHNTTERGTVLDATPIALLILSAVRLTIFLSTRGRHGYDATVPAVLFLLYSVTSIAPHTPFVVAVGVTTTRM